ncbi:MAG TPA: TPM domain-containing protein [Caulobacteraceae bacterium]|jgi:putative membrane protein|nr:TPM domain-containing protein [Caulobacteraceae bacterium]
MLKLSDADRDRIAAAVTDAESKTSGEIFCVLAKKVGEYREAAFAWAAVFALALPFVGVPFGLTPDKLPLPFLGAEWRAAQASAIDSAVTNALIAYALTQALLFVVLLLIFLLPPVRRVLTPKVLKRERVRRAALEQFFSKALHLSEGRTGVLIFASEAEKMVEIVADEDIHGKAGEDTWEGAADLLVRGIKAGKPADGYVDAIHHVGHVLAQHFPAKGPNPNQLPDRLIEI